MESTQSLASARSGAGRRTMSAHPDRRGRRPASGTESASCSSGLSSLLPATTAAGLSWRRSWRGTSSSSASAPSDDSRSFRQLSGRSPMSRSAGTDGSRCDAASVCPRFPIGAEASAGGHPRPAGAPSTSSSSGSVTTRDRPDPEGDPTHHLRASRTQERDPGHLELFGPWTEGDPECDGGRQPHAAECPAVLDQLGPERRALGKIPARTNTTGYGLAGDDGRPGQDEGQAGADHHPRWGVARRTGVRDDPQRERDDQATQAGAEQTADDGASRRNLSLRVHGWVAEDSSGRRRTVPRTGQDRRKRWGASTSTPCHASFPP
jgi:hypothetical protein